MVRKGSGGLPLKGLMIRLNGAVKGSALDLQ